MLDKKIEPKNPKKIKAKKWVEPEAPKLLPNEVAYMDKKVHGAKKASLGEFVVVDEDDDEEGYCMLVYPKSKKRKKAKKKIIMPPQAGTEDEEKGE